MAWDRRLISETGADGRILSITLIEYGLSQMMLINQRYMELTSQRKAENNSLRSD
ncbi:hypothetical protein LDG_8042 [Legionella drancourtii LLAP12]|uniref:Uncharacterized protein n=1 Tax=Legionella drancourtii LLAP12 TaxID=658187 RepID=G9ERX3_9GAMM|nr:hypothetical protein LDG_8042 [Legionella drancourtii LLAP12]